VTAFLGFGAPEPRRVCLLFGAPEPRRVCLQFGAPEPRRVCLQFGAPEPQTGDSTSLAARVARGVAMLVAACVLGCASAPPIVSSAPEPEPVEEPERVEAEPDMSTSAEVGGLDVGEAEESFRSSIDGLEHCVSEGVQRLAYLGGEIEFAVQVDASRTPARVWALQSTLGERATEKCMFDALKAVRWPKPVGGRYAIAKNSFEFEPRKGMPNPAVWDAGRVGDVLAELEPTLASCRAGDPKELLVTMYIGSGGKALSGGVSSSEAVDDGAVDCVMDALLAAPFPEPERSPTKVRFTL